MRDQAHFKCINSIKSSNEMVNCCPCMPHCLDEAKRRFKEFVALIQGQQGTDDINHKAHSEQDIYPRGPPPPPECTQVSSYNAQPVQHDNTIVICNGPLTNYQDLDSNRFVNCHMPMKQVTCELPAARETPHDDYTKAFPGPQENIVDNPSQENTTTAANAKRNEVDSDHSEHRQADSSSEDSSWATFTPPSGSLLSCCQTDRSLTSWKA